VFQFNVGPLLQFPLWVVGMMVLAAFVAGGIFGPKLFAKLGVPGLAIGVQVVESLESKLKKLSADLVAKQKAAAVLNLPPEQLAPEIQAAIAAHFASTK
jgi:hypothetical protein